MDFQRLPARRILHLELRSPRSYCGDMKRLSSFLPVICLLSLAPLARGQDNATAAARQEEIDERFKRLSGQVDDILKSQAEQLRRLGDLEDAVKSLRDQQSRPNASYASQED